MITVRLSPKLTYCSQSPKFESLVQIWTDCVLNHWVIRQEPVRVSGLLTHIESSLNHGQTRYVGFCHYTRLPFNFLSPSHLPCKTQYWIDCIALSAFSMGHLSSFQVSILLSQLFPAHLCHSFLLRTLICDFVCTFVLCCSTVKRWESAKSNTQWNHHIHLMM